MTLIVVPSQHTEGNVQNLLKAKLKSKLMSAGRAGPSDEVVDNVLYPAAGLFFTYRFSERQQ